MIYGLLHTLMQRLQKRISVQMPFTVHLYVSRDTSLLVRTFLVSVRPLVEYSWMIWSPHLKQDIEAVESVQRRFIIEDFLGLGNFHMSQRELND